jgi:hypothetical protein
MRAEKLGIPLQRFRKYSSSYPFGTAGFGVEKRWRFPAFSAVIGGGMIEAAIVHRISTDLSAEAVESGCEVAG